MVSHHLPRRLKAYDERIAESGFRATVMVRLMTGLVPPSHWLFGLSNIKFLPYLLGSALGYVPLTFAVVYTVSIVITMLYTIPFSYLGSAVATGHQSVAFFFMTLTAVFGGCGALVIGWMILRNRVKSL